MKGLSEKGKSVLSLLLVIAILFGGLCVEKNYAEFSFLQSDFQDQTIAVSYHRVLFNNVCEIEQSGQTNPANIIRQSARRILFRFVKGATVGLSSVELLSQSISPLMEVRIALFPSENCAHAILISYVHNQDGKKG